MLDFTSREKILGKPVGNDLREGKVTLPLIYALESAAAERQELVETVLWETTTTGAVLADPAHYRDR